MTKIVEDIMSELEKQSKNGLYGNVTIEVNFQAGHIKNVNFGVKKSVKYE